MITPPPNPNADQARAAVCAYNAPLLANPPRESAPEIVIAQWHRGDVERTFSERDVEAWWAMARAISAAAHGETKGAG